MKRLILAVLAGSVLVSAQAQSVISDALGGAVLGTMIGGIAGGNCHDGFSGNGAAIGAGVGLLVGAVAGEVQRQNSYASQPCYSYPANPAPQVYQPAVNPAPVHQIADAPRVPDAPSF